jgi:DNA-binding NarL/FixJ family response regulator
MCGMFLVNGKGAWQVVRLMPNGAAPDKEPPFHVLVVDDDALVRRALERTLRVARPIEVEHFGRGEEAIARFGEAHFHLAILDLQMPELTGVDVAKRLRAIRDDVRLLFITADPASALADEARRLTSEGILPKPWPSDALLAVVQAARPK